LERHEEIKKELISHYNNLLSNPYTNRREAKQCIKREIPSLVSPNHNHNLMRKGDH